VVGRDSGINCSVILSIYFLQVWHAQTRLNPFASSWFFNATAVRGALWWLRQSHSVNYANHQHSPDGANPILQFLAPKKLFGGGGASPHLGTALETPFSPLSFTINFHEHPFSRSRERLSHKCGERKKKKKTDCKTYTHPLRGCVKYAGVHHRLKRTLGGRITLSPLQICSLLHQILYAYLAEIYQLARCFCRKLLITHTRRERQTLKCALCNSPLLHCRYENKLIPEFSAAWMSKILAWNIQSLLSNHILGVGSF